MDKIIEIKAILNKKLTLKEQLDEIDSIIKQAAWDGYYWSRLNILMGNWEKGNAILEYRGVKSSSFYQLEKETGRSQESLKKWYELYENYPDRIEYIELYAKPRAKNWTEKALNPSGLFLSESSEWTTPQLIIDKTIQLLGEIDLDPCSNPDFPNVPAKNHFRKEDDAFSKEWYGKIYMNPPYGSEIKNWINYLCEQYEKNNVKKAIALTPSRTDTRWFRKLKNHPRCFIWGRLKFGDSNNSAPFPSMIVYLGEDPLRFTDIFSNIGDTYGLIR